MQAQAQHVACDQGICSCVRVGYTTEQHRHGRKAVDVPVAESAAGRRQNDPPQTALWQTLLATV